MQVAFSHVIDISNLNSQKLDISPFILVQEWYTWCAAIQRSQTKRDDLSTNGGGREEDGRGNTPSPHQSYPAY